MENEQIQEFCEEGLKISELKGVQRGLSFLIGEKFGRIFLQLKNHVKNYNSYIPVRMNLKITP